MEEEVKALEGIPDDNCDLLGAIEKDLGEGKKKQEGAPTEVVDMFYYDTLGVAPDADKGAIKRKYYLLARQYHPDNKFKVMGEA
jgi:hypothetical protein